MSKGRGINPGGWCLRCAYFGLPTKAVTNLSGDPTYGDIYCQECAEYLYNVLPPDYRSDKRPSRPQTTHHDKEAT